MLDKIESSIDELVEMMRQAPHLIDKKLVHVGQNAIAVYFDRNYGSGIENYRPLKTKLLRSALVDLTSGGFLLKTRKIGLIFRDNRLFEYNAPYNETNPNGQVAASISLKSMRAFDGFRTKKEEDHILSDDERNAAIYYLIFLIAQER